MNDTQMVISCFPMALKTNGTAAHYETSSSFGGINYSLS